MGKKTNLVQLVIYAKQMTAASGNNRKAAHTLNNNDKGMPCLQENREKANCSTMTTGKNSNALEHGTVVMGM